MTRAMSPEREKEYEELSAYVNFFATAVWGVSPSDPSHPSNAAIAERFGRTQALQGARQACWRRRRSEPPRRSSTAPPG